MDATQDEKIHVRVNEVSIRLELLHQTLHVYHMTLF
jgi:hypothetical protein